MSIAPQQNTSVKHHWLDLGTSWFAGTFVGYFLTSFFSFFYSSLFAFVVLSLFFSLVCGLGINLVFYRTLEAQQAEKHPDWVAIINLLVAFALAVSAVLMVWQYPGLFQRRILFMDSGLLPLFVLLSVISLVPLFLWSQRVRRIGFVARFEQSQWTSSIRSNWPGLALAIFFFFTYFVFAETINFPEYRTLDLYFDTDISEWIKRLTLISLQDVSIVRAVHPGIMLFLRLPIWFISLFLNGNRLHALFLLNALAGAGCVLLAWLIIKKASGNATYALIIASLLGASCSHLLLSSMLETYIYSALAILFFVYLLQTDRTSLRFTIPAGILVFGITVTNIVQTGILYLIKYPRVKVLIKYLLAVLLATAVLNMIQLWLYPNAQSLFQPSSLMYEQRYVFKPKEFSWRAVGRAKLISRAVPLYGVVAPTPFILTDEMGMDVPNFRTFQILLGQFHVAAYRGFADITVKFWMLILGVAGILFVLNFRKSPKEQWLALGLLCCLVFNFALHLVYGDDPMLYSPDWVYTLVLFVGLAFQKWADKRWLQLVMVVFLVMLLYTNLGLIYQIMDVSAPFYSQ